jgi:hypothetical protein
MKIMARIKRKGAKSIPPIIGSLRLMGYNTGSVADIRNRTMGLYGSALTQEIITRPKIINM